MQLRTTQFKGFTWIDICQPDKEKLSELATAYGLDVYQIRDSIETGHLPKIEEQTNYTFLILRAFTARVNDRITNVNELSNKIAFFYNKEKIITIHRSEFSFLNDASKDFECQEQLLIHLIDKMLDTFVAPVEKLSLQIDHTEHNLFLKDNSKVSLENLYYLKTQTRITKKLLHITDNVLQQIQVQEESKTALQNVKDQLLSLHLAYDEVSEDAHNLLHTYLSVNAQKSNDVMKLLTVFSAFFLPLTFIVGVYGMNFENMPELKMQSGYYWVLGIMMLVVIFIGVWFKRKKII